MSGLMTFNFEGKHPLRTVVLENAPWFFATDTAKTLGYKTPHDAIKRHCRRVRETRTLVNSVERSVNIINEGDVYRLIFGSKLPSAQKFEAWVVDEVLPAIRKHGSYSANQVAQAEIGRLGNLVAILRHQVDSAYNKAPWSRLLTEYVRANAGGREMFWATAKEIYGADADKLAGDLLGAAREGLAFVEDYRMLFPSPWVGTAHMAVCFKRVEAESYLGGADA